MKFDRKKFVINGLRQLTKRWPPRYRVENKSKKKIQEGFFKNGNPKLRIKYQCNSCKGFFARKDRQMDHVEPVVELSGFTNWDDYIERMLPWEDGWQCLCKGCHKIKTTQENKIRKQIANQKRAEKKLDKPD